MVEHQAVEGQKEVCGCPKAGEEDSKSSQGCLVPMQSYGSREGKTQGEAGVELHQRHSERKERPCPNEIGYSEQ